jgi:hypothetical protein
MRKLVVAGICWLAGCATPASYLNPHTSWMNRERCPANSTPIYRTHEGERRFAGCLNYNDVSRLVR